MDEFVQLAVAHLGLPERSALSATHSVMSVLSSKMSDGEFAELATAVPGASAAIRSGNGSAGVGAALRGFLSDISGASSEEHPAGAVTQLVLSGIRVDQISPFVQLFFSYIEVRAGADVLQTVLAAIPELAAHIRDDN